MTSEEKIPKYIRIFKWLDDQIKTGRIKIGDKLPPEESIARDFGINRMTVRQAIDEFVSRKMVTRRRGYGTVLVRNTPVEYIWQFNNISSFTESMEKSGIEAFTRSDRAEVTEADERVAGLLSLGSDRRVIHTLRIKHAENEPVCIERSYLPYKRFKRILEIEIRGSLYRMLLEEFNTYLVKSTQYLTSVLSDSENTSLFGLSRPVSCLMVESLSIDSEGIPVEVLYSCFRGDRYRFKIESGEYQYQKKQDRD